ncbi:MAG TPA: TonB-dependent receptor [Acidobacteriaceae bacterium]|nr:TonB-dependent receptor [Acidobacteriaceae bacterium]
MLMVKGRPTASLALRAFSALAAFLLLSNFLVFAPVAHAVVVRGVVTDALGKPVPAARVQLIQGKNSVAAGVSGIDGSYEIRSAVGGRFVLLTSAAKFYPGIGQDFYGGVSDEVTQNVVLETGSVHQQVTVTATGMPMPIEQASSAVTLIPDAYLATTIGVVDALRQSPGVDVVQLGQMGGATSLFVRGGNSDANKVLIDGIPAEDVGGRFDFGTVSSSGVTGMEIYRGPDSVLYGSDAASSTIAFTTPRGSDPKPVLNYTGSAGNFHTYQNEGTVSGAHKRVDYLFGYSRVDTSNALPMDEYHDGTAVANLGYDITANTPLRFTLRNSDSATGVPDAHDFFGLSAAAKEADQDLYSGVTLEHTSLSAWHNLVRYGIARKREQGANFYPVGMPVAGPYGVTYYGNQVTIRGANGYSATGQAAIGYGCAGANPTSCFPEKDDSDSNRDEVYYQTDYVLPKHVAALFGFRYEKERGSFNYPTYFEAQAIQRTNFEYTAQISGNIESRLFYSLGGAVEKNHLYGIAGTPRIGLAYVPVRPGGRLMRGTKLRVNVATGVQEPSLSMDFQSLYTQLRAQGSSGLATIKADGITPIRELRTRTLDAGIEQNIYRDKLIFKAGYYHNAFSHQVEYVDAGILIQVFQLPAPPAHLFGADVGTMAFHAQGIESELDYQPFSRLFLRAGYTYLNAKVDQSFASSALSVLPGGYASTNPAYPNIPVGSSPFVGSRPFRRPPNTGFFAAQYTGGKLSASLKGAFASRSDDSTFLDYADLAGSNSLILPNRNLDYGYAKLDANVTYAVRRRVTVFSELDNLLSQQHIGPIGFPALPFTVRSGLKVRIGGE